jgi:hypothetical protein
MPVRLCVSKPKTFNRFRLNFVFEVYTKVSKIQINHYQISQLTPTLKMHTG